MKKVPTLAPAVRELTHTELRWLDAFQRMDDRRQYYNLIAMEGQARRFPRTTATSLKLIAGGKQ